MADYAQCPCGARFYRDHAASAEFPELRALLSTFPCLLTDLRARAACARAPKWVFETCDRLVQLIVVLRCGRR